MKMKIQVLYLTGTALLIGAAGVGDSITFDAVGSWTGAAILAVLMAAGGWRSSRRRRRSCAGTAGSSGARAGRKRRTTGIVREGRKMQWYGSR